MGPVGRVCSHCPLLTSEFGTDHRNNALCVHLILNSTLTLNFAGTAASHNDTVIQRPPQLLSAANDAWWSVYSGQHWARPPSLKPFRLCVQYVSQDNATQVGVCVSLDGSFDLTAATTPNLMRDSSSAQYGWQSENPFVATMTISPSQSDDMLWH